MTHAKLSEFLRLLLPDSAETAAQLTGYFENRTLKKGETILQEGEICDSAYFVESGYLRTCYEKEGVDITLNFHLDGSITTDHRNAKAGIPSPFALKAGEKSEIGVLKLKKLEELCYANEQIMVFGRRLISHIALDLHAHSDLLKIYSPAERYAYIEKNRTDLLQRVSVAQLASYLGMNRRTLTRIRGESSGSFSLQLK